MNLQLTAFDHVLLVSQILTQAILLLSVYYMFTAHGFRLWRSYLWVDLCATVAATLLGSTELYTTGRYGQMWWIYQGVNFCMICAVSVQVLSISLHQFSKMVKVYSVAAGVAIIFIVSAQWPPFKTPDMIVMSTNACRVCGFLLLMGVLFIKQWPRSMYGITIGMIVKIVAAFGGSYIYGWSIDHRYQHFEMIRYGHELMAIFILWIWLVATWTPKVFDRMQHLFGAGERSSASQA